MADENRDFFRVAAAERQRHELTLRYLNAVLELNRIQMADGSYSTEYCRICQHAPAGESLVARRQRCPCKHLHRWITTEMARLRKPMRLADGPQKPDPIREPPQLRAIE